MPTTSSSTARAAGLPAGPGLALALLLVLAACTGGSAMEPTLTEEQARDRAEQHIQEAIAALPDEPTLNLLSDYSDECTDPTDNGPQGRYQVGKTYWLDDLSPERNDAYLDALRAHWEANNYRISSDNRPDDRTITVEHNEDAFRMSVVARPDDQRLSLGAGSPCIWPEGTPPEDDEPGF
ncbi:hypothetical protein H0B56_06300 [Haloechinothrix sp. YIM 98757]|uniref:Lipoprotein n=1 Tax=Haloechinothrix aidingensis TaxID=2752311 RepID=A0A838A7G1_9PSEU|nr:hypothetical protein [Haloechinothrix aidingensis]MBA0125148.1 hypothetical protein [Haloechinothrix aidingensis]